MSGKKTVHSPAWSWQQQPDEWIKVQLTTEWFRWKGLAPPADAEAVKRFLHTLETENVGRSAG